MCAVLPHMSDDEVGWRNEEVVDPLKSCPDGVVNFTYTGLRDNLTKKKNIMKKYLNSFKNRNKSQGSYFI